MHTRQRQLLGAAILLLIAGLGWLKWDHAQRSVSPLAAGSTLNTPEAKAVLSQPLLGTRPAPPSPALAKKGEKKWIKTRELDITQTTPHVDPKFPWRLRNTDRSLKDLAHSERALLLRNAFVDTASSEPLAVPGSLRSGDDPGFYIVQASHAPDARFLQFLAASDARVVTYIPNNAYLVEASREAMDRVAESPQVAALMSYDPYLKLTPSLLSSVLQGAAADTVQLVLNTTSPNDTRAKVDALGGQVLASDQGAFGELLKVEVPSSSVALLAASSKIHLVEPLHPRKFANDRTAYALGTAPTPTNNTRFLNLTGTNVLLNINDSGVDTNHPDLTGRVFALDTNVFHDVVGHGTHVAASIIGNGVARTNIASTPQGSVTNASYEGEAPGGKLFALPVDLRVGSALGDRYLQATARRYANTNGALNYTLISNNSWGYDGAFDYDSASASYDAAVRDALPDEKGEQPIVYVFAAGNSGFGTDFGVGGYSDVINSPANGKNTIAVGAVESARNLTNVIVYDENFVPVFAGNTSMLTNSTSDPEGFQTNAIYANATDTDSDIAGYSSRGNVAIGSEGDFGRFKPDVVAPGEFIISAASTFWNLTNDYNPAFPSQAADYYFWKSLDDPLAKTNTIGYRYLRGTSMAAPAISGVLALIEEYFEHQNGDGRIALASPAVYKALLINSARATDPRYYPNFTEALNYSGWGMPNLTNALRSGLKDTKEDKQVAAFVSEGIATGQSESYVINLTTAATNAPLRVTLSWTDPAGNPAAAIRLVNDLDLLVTSGTNAYVGNLMAGSGFTIPLSTNDVSLTNAVRYFDYVNNTEQVVIEPPLAKQYTITVIGRRVNVNAAATTDLDLLEDSQARTNIIQDYAIAFTAEASDLSSPETTYVGTVDLETKSIPISTQLAPGVDRLTNGVPRFNERVGANSPLMGGLAGTTNQWHFYVFTNKFDTNSPNLAGLTNGSNVAFVTFEPPNLSLGRGATTTNYVFDNEGNLISRQIQNLGEADIDLYVSLDPGLTNLTDDAVLHAFKSVTRGGTEYVVFTNAPADGEIYYIGVKSEDQQAAEYSFIALSSNQEFGKQGTNGLELRGIPIINPIPDGRPDQPGVGRVMALGLDSRTLRRAYTSTGINHSNILDLQAQLKHTGLGIDLLNHRPVRDYYSGRFYSTGAITNIIDDAGSRFYPTSQNSDGPGSLNTFMGERISGPWFLNTIDSTSGQTGRVDNFTIIAQPNDFAQGVFVHRVVLPNAIESEVIDVPADADSLTITITNVVPPLPLEVFIKRGSFPVITNVDMNDKHATITGGWGVVRITYRDVPPLQAGRYFIAVYNPNSATINYDIKGEISRNLPGKYTLTLHGDNASLTDVAQTISSITVPDNRIVTDVKVGLRVEDQRVSDLAIRLTTPTGKQALVFENRGRTTTDGLGGELVLTNYQHVALSIDRLTRIASLYFNGDLINRAYIPTNVVIATDGDLYFGVDPSGKVVPSQAAIQLDDFGLWRRALRDDEIRSIFDNGYFERSKDLTMTDSGLLSWWKFNGDGKDTIRTNNVLLSGAETTVPGQIDTALKFPAGGTGGRVAASSSSDPVAGGGMTLEGWIKSPIGNTNLVIAGWRNPTNGFGPALMIGAFGSINAGQLSAVFHNVQSNLFEVDSSPGLLAANGLTTNTSYATFVDDPEGTPVPIKFATPPYLDKVFQGVLTNAGFEDIAPLVYVTNSVVDGWIVKTNVIEIVNDNVFPAEGKQFLSLLNGVIEQEFFLPLGRRYRMHVAYRTAPGAVSGEALLVVNGAAISTLTGNGAWQTNTIALENSDSHFDIQLRATKPSSLSTNAIPGLAIDNIVIEQLGDTQGLLPEEAFDNLKGTLSAGDWQLEVTDARGLITGTLVSWELRLTLAPDTVPIVRLTNGIPYDDSTAGTVGQYFYVEVPPEAQASIITLISLAGAPLDLYYSDRGVPDGSEVTDLRLADHVTQTNTSIILANATAPPILPRGQRFYLSVINSDGSAATAPFRIQVDNVLGITPLSSGIEVTNTIVDPSSISYYSFNVSTNALAVEFLVEKMDADVNLLVTKAPKLPSRVVYDYASANTGTTNEYISIDPSSSPVALSAGTWLLGVYNAGSVLAPVTYTVVATEITATNLHRLDPGITVTTNLPAKSTDYYYFDVSDVPFSAEVDLTALSGNADLFISRHLPLPGPTSYDLSSTNLSTAPESIAWNYFTTLPLEPGRWYAAVVNRETNAVNYSLTLQFDATGPTIEVLTEDVALTRTSPTGPTDKFYKFTVEGGVGAVLFEIYDLTGDADLTASPDDLPGVASVSFSDLQSGTKPELMVITPNDVDFLTRDWYLRVSVPAGQSSTYTIRASTDRSGLLTSGEIKVTTQFTPTNIILSWYGITNQFYQVESTTDLTAPIAWTPVSSVVNPFQATSRVVTVELPAPDAADVQRYYRVVQVAAP